MTGKRIALAALLVASLAASGRAEDGSRLWLRYDPIADSTRRATLRAAITSIVISPASPTLRVAADELEKGTSGLLGTPIPVRNDVAADGAVIAGTPKSTRLIATLGWSDRLAALGNEGYLIRSARVGSHAVTVIAANTDIGVTYGAFHFLRLMQTGAPIVNLNVSSRPRLQLRLLDHWDNLNGSMERGYAGQSIWWPDPDARIA